MIDKGHKKHNTDITLLIKTSDDKLREIIPNGNS
jgi:hypothetical protein